MCVNTCERESVCVAVIMHHIYIMYCVYMQGVKFLRKLKYWLNPVQVFDLAITGPDLG